MPKIQDYIITDFSGGLVKNKSDLEMNRNEFINTLNCDLEDRGRLKRRFGISQYGDTLTGIIDNSYSFTRQELGNIAQVYHIVVNRNLNATVNIFQETYLTTAITTASTTLALADSNNFASPSGTVEIEGDLIAYTGQSGDNLTGASGILRSHPANAPVHQFIASSATTDLDTTSGCYFTVLNNVLIINALRGSFTFDGSSVTAISDADEATGLFATNYRDRVYVAGSGLANASGLRNGDPRRVSFTDAGDATSWDINNFFDVEDDMGESITGLSANDDFLYIFKTNSIFTYSEVELKQQLWGVGAYNDRVIQLIDKVMYTFCPQGVYATNGFSAEKISDSIEPYLRGFKPAYDTTNGRVVNNCFAGKLRNKYYLYIGTITYPESLSDAVLIYDTIKKNWTIHSGYTNLRHFASLNRFARGRLADSVANNQTTQEIESLFAGDTGGRYYRLFEDRFLDNAATRTLRGGDILQNMRQNSNGTAIQTILEMPFNFLGSQKWKTIGAVSLIVEQGYFQLSYRLDQGNKKTDWISLGNFSAGTITKKLRINNDG